VPPSEVSPMWKDRLGRLRPARRRRDALGAPHPALHVHQRPDRRAAARSHPTMVAPMTDSMTSLSNDYARRS